MKKLWRREVEEKMKEVQRKEQPINRLLKRSTGCSKNHQDRMNFQIVVWNSHAIKISSRWNEFSRCSVEFSC